MSAADEPTFTVRLDMTTDQEVDGAPAVRLDLAGELDAHAATQLDSAVDQVVRAGATQLVIDLGEVTFIDSSGLRSLIRARQQLGNGDVPSLTLDRARPATLRLLEITGLLDQFRLA